MNYSNLTTSILALSLTSLAVASEDAVPEGLSSGDWSSIHEAYQAGRHAIQSQADGSFTAENPRQQWRTLFDGRGFLVSPQQGDWTWGMDLQSVGKTQVSGRPEVEATYNTLRYHWSEQVEEWFINDQRGLEQGWTISERSESALKSQEPLLLNFTIRGELRPAISAGGRSVSFLKDEATVLTYGGLKAWDANGEVLTVSFHTGANEQELQIAVDDASASYPITIDPIAQQVAYLKASNTGIADRFGESVSVSGDTVVVGASGEGSSATGVNGDQSDNSVTGSGAAYVFVRSGGSWQQQAYLKASNTDDVGDGFGFSVSISGDTVVVGASGESSSATGVNGNQSDNSADDSGAAYVFVRSGVTWQQQAYLKASNTDSGDNFGDSVSISGDTLVIGARFEDSSATGVNGDQGNNSARDSGAAYVFMRSGGSWQQLAYLKASNTDAREGFGFSVSVSGDTVVVGASGEDSSATEVNGDQSDNSAPNSGAAYVFVRSGVTWQQQAYLKASNTDRDDNFGYSVSISGDTVVVGAQDEDSSATGVNGDQSDDNPAFNSGAAYVFVRSGGIWQQQAYLKASNTDASDEFGRSVSMSGDTVVVGASFEESSSTGVNGDQSDNSARGSGAAYVFVRNGDSWQQQAYLKASNTDTDLLGDRFGFSVSVSGDTVVIGADREESSATGVNGDQSNNSVGNSGAAYLFELDLPSVLTPTTITITDLGFTGDNFFIEIAEETTGLVITSSDTLDFANSTVVNATIDPSNSNRFLIPITERNVAKDFFRVETP